MKQVFGLVLFLAYFFVNILAQYETSSTAAIPSGRIVNGSTIVSIANYRFVVAIRQDDFAYCGASVITWKHALTAAHCFDHNPPIEELTIYGGSTNQNSGGVIFIVSDVIIHPEYRSTGINYDAALVKVQGSFAGHQYIAPIKLQDAEITLSKFKTSWCYIVGWGYTDGGRDDNPEMLQQMWMLLLSQYSCANQWGEELLTPEMICTQLPNVDICSGDSGGPLVCGGKLTGIVSWGTSDCSGDWPAVFARVVSKSIRNFISLHAGI